MRKNAIGFRLNNRLAKITVFPIQESCQKGQRGRKCIAQKITKPQRSCVLHPGSVANKDSTHGALQRLFPDQLAAISRVSATKDASRVVLIADFGFPAQNG
jgi:hypothetical protein